jgi:hypothetical protein
MKSENIVSLVEDIFSEYQYSLSSVDVAIIKGVFDSKNYKKIASSLYASPLTIMNQADKLCWAISAAMGTNIYKEDLGSFLQIIYKQKIQIANGILPKTNIVEKIERSIEFPPEYWGAGTSILSYFSHVLHVKYPNKKIKVRIEQEGLTIRMIVDTSNGQREKIEKTLDEYGLVIRGEMRPEDFMSDPSEVLALKNKLEIAALELRLTKDSSKHSLQRIESLEMQVEKLHSIIEKGLNSGNNVIGVINKMAEQNKSTYNLENAKFGGGFAAEGGLQVGGQLIDLSAANSLADAAKEIQELLQQLQKQGASPEDATQQAASDLAAQAKANPGVMSKVVKWGMDTAGKTTVGEATKGVIKLTLQLLGIPLP